MNSSCPKLPDPLKSAILKTLQIPMNPQVPLSYSLALTLLIRWSGFGTTA